MFVSQASKTITIQSLWIGKALSPLEQLSINSYLRHGHEFHLYTYGPVAGLPKGVQLKNAGEIVPLETLHYDNFPSLALFSDFFRYKLLLEKGGWWSDTDAVCLRPFDFELPYVFSSEATQEGGTHINGGTIRVPEGSLVVRYCWEKCLRTDVSKTPWGGCGPALLQEAVEALFEPEEISKVVQPPQVFCPVPWWETRRFADPGFQPDTTGSYAVHLWNAMWTEYKMDKTKLPTSLQKKRDPGRLARIHVALASWFINETRERGNRRSLQFP